jgi:hypothetical protein
LVDNVVVLPANTSLGKGRVLIKGRLPSGQCPRAVAAGEAGVDEGA